MMIMIALAALIPKQFTLEFAIGSFVTAAFFMLPLMLRTAEVMVHWIKPQE
jgi:hypothetical protein